MFVIAEVNFDYFVCLDAYGLDHAKTLLSVDPPLEEEAIQAAIVCCPRPERMLRVDASIHDEVDEEHAQQVGSLPSGRGTC